MRKILIFAYVGIFFLVTLPLLLLYWLLGLFSVCLLYTSDAADD